VINAPILTRAAAALAVAAFQACFAGAVVAAEDAPLPPPPNEPMMVVQAGEGQALELYPEGQVFPESAYICLPEESGFLAFLKADGELYVLTEGGCNVSISEPVTADPSEEELESPLAADAELLSDVSPDPASQSDAGSDEVVADQPPAHSVRAERSTPRNRAREALIVKSVGPDAETYPVGSRASRICLEETSKVTVVTAEGTRVISGPGCSQAVPRGISRRFAARRMQHLMGPQAVRATTARSARNAPSEQLIVIRGSELSLAFYPVGSRLAANARLCLPAEAGFITLQRTSGGTITYGDDGCNKRADDPTTAADESLGVGSGP